MNILRGLSILCALSALRHRQDKTFLCFSWGVLAQWLSRDLIIAIFKKGAAMGKNLSDGDIQFLNSYRISATVEKEVSFKCATCPLTPMKILPACVRELLGAQS